jgi:hypothetical protein
MARTVIPPDPKPLPAPSSHAVLQFEEYLVSLHTITWHRWTVTDPHQRRQAAEWFIEEQRKFANWLITNRTSPRGKTAYTANAYDVVT